MNPRTTLPEAGLPLDGPPPPTAPPPSPPGPSRLDEDRDYHTPPPRRVFFVQVHYRRLGRGAPMPLAPDDLDNDEP
jgi:hypothetical protein